MTSNLHRIGQELWGICNRKEIQPKKMSSLQSVCWLHLQKCSFGLIHNTYNLIPSLRAKSDHNSKQAEDHKEITERKKMLVCRQLHTEQESCKSRVPFGERNQKIFQLKELKNQMSHFNAKKNNAYRRSHKMPDDKCCCKIFFFFFWY